MAIAEQVCVKHRFHELGYRARRTITIDLCAIHRDGNRFHPPDVLAAHVGDLGRSYMRLAVCGSSRCLGACCRRSHQYLEVLHHCVCRRYLRAFDLVVLSPRAHRDCWSTWLPQFNGVMELRWLLQYIVEYGLIVVVTTVSIHGLINKFRSKKA